MENEIDNFANILSAGVNKTGVADYCATCNDFMAKLDIIEQKVNSFPVIQFIGQYENAGKLKDVLSSLYCYAFNNKLDYEGIGRIESIIGNNMYKFCCNYRKIKDKTIRAFAKYLVWPRHYRSEKVDYIIRELFIADKLRKKDGRYYVIGLHFAAGDNTFGVAKNGGQYRLYVKHCAIMAIPVSNEDDRKTTLDTLPIQELEPYYTVYGVYNGKGGLKISLSQQEKSIVYKSQF